MADCFNCKHRRNMVCIPESNDCEKVYLLDDHDVFEVNKDKCDFYFSRDRIYDYSSHYGSVRYTRDIFHKEIYDHSGPFKKTFSFDNCILCINGIVNKYDHIILTILDTGNYDENDLKIFKISQCQELTRKNVRKYDIEIHCKCITIHKEDDMIIVNGLNFLGGEE